MTAKKTWLVLVTTTVLTATAATACIAPSPTVSAPSQGGGAPGQRPAVVVPTARTGASFLEEFTGAPGAPTPWRSGNWDIQVHSRDQLGNTLDPMQAMHGPDCAGPPAVHDMSAFDDAVFQCKDHMMTSIKAEGYGLIYLTPDHMVDFSRGEAVVSLDASTLVTSKRDWWDLWITPYEDNLALPGEDWYPDLQGGPRRGVHIKMEAFDSTKTGFMVRTYNNFSPTVVPGNYNTPYESVLTPDAARRDRFELRISRNHIRFGMPAYNLWWVDAAIPDLGWDAGVVQIGHHSYNPNKDDVVPNAHAGTWHWDNVAISPARPFNIISANERVAQPTATFPEPAPANAMLRFAGYGTQMEVSFNGGGWVGATKQAQAASHDDHFSSYWTPVPAGTTSVQFRGQPAASTPAQARDISIFAP